LVAEDGSEYNKDNNAQNKVCHFSESLRVNSLSFVNRRPVTLRKYPKRSVVMRNPAITSVERVLKKVLPEELLIEVLFRG
jgi:hypothetical protein